MSLGLPDLPDLLSTGAAAPGSVPRVKLEKRAPGGGAPGGLGGLGSDLLAAAASAAGALGVAQPDPLTDALTSLQVELLAAPSLATCRLQFLPRADFPALAPGDPITVKLSDGAAPVPVFAGTVARISGSRGALEVLLVSAASKLARVRRNAGYESQGFGDLLKTWAGEAALTPGHITSGPDYAFLAVDDRLSLWDWVARLALHADVPAWTDAAGALHATKPAGQPVATFKFGQTLLALDAHARDPVITGAHIVGEGSAGRQGSDAWSWLAKDPQGVSASGGTGGALGQEGGLRDLASVAAAAAGAVAGQGRIADLVEVRVPGTPALDIAAVFKLEGCPQGVGDGQWSALEVRHRFDARSGFVTEVVGAKFP
ncbi:MAG: hypothetical protein U1F50_08185 [Rubrivivax sp.]